MLLIAILENIEAFPIRKLTDDDWDTLLELIEKSKNPSFNNNEYYESFALEPIIFKMDFDDSFKKKESIKITPPKLNNKKDVSVSLVKVPEETSFWTSVKSFFTNDLNSLVKDVADNYNPIPPIVSAIDDVKRSDTWVDVNSFFTKGYNQFVKLSESTIDDLKKIL